MMIAEQVWDMNFDSDANVVEVAIKRLRAKVDNPYPIKLLHTVRGMGYVLETRREQSKLISFSVLKRSIAGRMALLFSVAYVFVVITFGVVLRSSLYESLQSQMHNELLFRESLMTPWIENRHNLEGLVDAGSEIYHALHLGRRAGKILAVE